MTRIIGIDPGSRRTGYGIIDVVGGKIAYVSSGIIRLPEKSLPDRLKIIFDGLSQLIEQYQPEQMGIEEVFLARNAWHLEDAEKNWPDIKFLAIKEQNLNVA